MAGGRESRIFTDDGPYLDRFGVLLVVTALGIVGLSLFDINDVESDSAWSDVGSWAASVLVAASLLIALRASGLARRRQRIIDVVVAIGLLGVTVVTVAALLGDGNREAGYNPVGAVAVLSVIVPIVVVRRLLRHRRVSSATLLGAIAAYLLIPMAFFHVFLAIDHYSPTPFFGEEQPSTSFMYFALVTVTTIGYGDLAAVTEPARLAATTLGLVGQVYLVVFVAMIVGLRAQEWRAGKGGELLPPPDRVLGREGVDDGDEHGPSGSQQG